MYPPSDTAQNLGKMDLMFKNDTDNKNIKYLPAEKYPYTKKNFTRVIFFPESIVSAASAWVHAQIKFTDFIKQFILLECNSSNFSYKSAKYNP